MLAKQAMEGVEETGFDHRVGHFRPLSIGGGVQKLTFPQVFRCFYREISGYNLSNDRVDKNERRYKLNVMPAISCAAEGSE